MRVPFEPPAGLVSNDTIYAALGAWADIDNMRFVEGRPQTIGGWQEIFPTALTGVCRNVHSWTNISGVKNIAFGTHSALQVYVAGSLANITPPGLIPGSIDNVSGGAAYGMGSYGSGSYSVPPTVFRLRTWSLDSWGETLVATPRGGTLYQWQNDPGSAAAPIANAPDEINAMLVTPERQLLALGCNEELSNDFNPLCIRGSDLEDINDWSTSSSNNAFEHILEGGGQILTGHMVGPVVAVWTDNALHQGQFLGNPAQTYRFDRIDENCGAIGPNAVCVHKGVAYWIGQDRQIRVWAPGTRPSILPCPIWKNFADNLHMAQADKLTAASNSRFDEVWFFYPDARDGSENSRYIALSTTAGTWFRGRLARSAACDAGVLSFPVAVTPQGDAYYHETGSDAAGDGLVWRARSAAHYLEEAQRTLQIQGVSPDFKDQEGAISLTIHARAHPQAAAISHGPYMLAPSATRTHFRLTGAIVELEFSGSGNARFGRPAFDAIATGRR